MSANLEDIVSLCKRRGFIYQGSEIYGGLSGTWDYGPLGVSLKRNITNLWWKIFVEDRADMYGLDTTILMNPKVWQASGHIDTFADPLVECLECKIRFRADQLDLQTIEDQIAKKGAPKNSAENFEREVMPSFLSDDFREFLNKNIPCPNCGKNHKWSQVRMFNMMFKTSVGPIETEDSAAYLRPETAQGMFTNFKNILDSFYPDLPFGIAQMGRNFRNEISPRDFIFRAREFEIMELEYFVSPDSWEKQFELWRQNSLKWFETLGLDKNKIKEIEVPAEDRAHYSKRTIDFHYDFPSLGFDEISGLAYRTDFDLKNHQEYSGKNLEYRPKDGGEAFIPHVIEPTYGIDRAVMAVISNSFTEDEVNGEKRTYLKLPHHLAPVKVAVSPLLKNKPELVAKAREVYDMLKKQFGAVMWDDNGNIGKRYRRQDEIGTPYCVVIDFETLEGETKDTVTIRGRDTTEQKRVDINDLSKNIDK